MVIYIISTSCVTFVLTLCLVTLNRLRKRNAKHLAVHSAVENENNENNTRISNQSHDHYDRVYDEIDETQMIDFPTQHSIPPVDCSSDTSSNDDCSLSDGYLNPYQPIVPDPKLHNYLKIDCPGLNLTPKNTNHKDENVDIHRPPKTNELFYD